VTTTSIIKITEETVIRPLNADGSYMIDTCSVETDSNENTVTITREENVVCEAVEGNNYVVTKKTISTVVKNDDQVILNGNANQI
jgi:hypothetical protein